MKSGKAIDGLLATGRAFFARRDLIRLFHEDKNSADKTVRRLCAQGALRRVAQGVYQFRYAPSAACSPLYSIATVIKRGEYVYESLESAASEWGLISQVPLGRVTLMTTGRSGLFKTVYGDIEFVHTAASGRVIRANTIPREGNPVPIATRAYTLANLRRTGRSLHLVEEMERYEAEGGGA